MDIFSPPEAAREPSSFSTSRHPKMWPTSTRLSDNHLSRQYHSQRTAHGSHQPCKDRPVSAFGICARWQRSRQSTWARPSLELAGITLDSTSQHADKALLQLSITPRAQRAGQSRSERHSTQWTSNGEPRRRAWSHWRQMVASVSCLLRKKKSKQIRCQYVSKASKIQIRKKKESQTKHDAL